MIDSERFRILMYDADKDILLCGMDLPIFYENHLNFTSIVILWMVLHYRIFCSGINGTPEELENVKCNFQEVTEEKWEIYRKSLKVGVSNFPNVKKETGRFPSYESILFGKRKW
jgi:competence CoiA-like predicted nuclease